MKRLLYNALDWTIGKLWNPAGAILIFCYRIKMRWLLWRAMRAARQAMKPLTRAQVDRLRAKVRREFPPITDYEKN